MEEIKRGARFLRAWSSWAAVGLLAVLCAVLALLQYRWLGEISRAEQQRLKDELTSKLTLLSQNFNREIENAARALIAPGEEIDTQGREAAYALNFRRWESTHERLFKHVALAIPADDSLRFEMLNPRGIFEPAEWPDDWAPMHEHILQRLRGGGPPSSAALSSTTLFEFPRFGAGGREQEWLIVELNVDYVRSTLLPELLARFLGGAGKTEYDAEVVETANPSNVIYRNLHEADHNSHTADASVGLLAIRPFGMGDRGPRPVDLRNPAPPPPGQGRWQLLVRHHAGSLEAAVAHARWRNIAISAGILLLILATVATLVRLSRQTQQLADLQMNFVAGVSHELRTPITVMSTAAYNLRGKIAANPAQVERYGALIQEQCEKLGATVEQVLRFSSMKSGKIVRERAPVAVEDLIDDEMRTARSLLERTGCSAEVDVAPDLPVILGDATALRHALQNLITNAVKYGCEGSNWIGVSARAVDGPGGAFVEIRVADRGPGIPAEEQRHIFDPFFRGARAVQDQIHGTGLGLNLVKRIVEAHGGTIEVESEPMKRTDFIVRLPAAPGEVQDEVAHSFG